MAKPRVILADLDVDYIMPLQLKFIEDFFDKIDLEVITEKEYFDGLFLTPQKADVLIVSEKLYDISLQRHNINNIFLLIEQHEEEQTSELNVIRLFKYTSIKEIFNEIVNKSAEVLNIKEKTKKDTQIVVVCSASGGTGKTTVSLGLSTCLANSFKRVLYINASGLQTFQSMLDDSGAISATSVYAKLASGDTSIYDVIKPVIRKEGFSYLPPFKASLVSLGLPFSIYESIVVAAKESKEFDYIVVDIESSFDENMLNLLNIANKVMVVTNQTNKAIYATGLFVKNTNGVNSDKYILVCNDFREDEKHELVASGLKEKFGASEYIYHFDQYNQMKCNDFAKDSGIQKITFLTI